MASYADHPAPECPAAPTGGTFGSGQEAAEQTYNLRIESADTCRAILHASAVLADAIATLESATAAGSADSVAEIAALRADVTPSGGLPVLEQSPATSAGTVGAIEDGFGTLRQDVLFIAGLLVGLFAGYLFYRQLMPHA